MLALNFNYQKATFGDENFQPHVATYWQFITIKLEQTNSHTHPPFSLSLLMCAAAETGAAAAAPCAATLGGFRPTLDYPDFPLLPAIMPNHLLHSKQPPHLINSSLKWGISQNPNLFYLEFYGCFLYGLCLDDQIDSYCAIFIEFGDF